jgi:PAS domain-containing protein
MTFCGLFCSQRWNWCLAGQVSLRVNLVDHFAPLLRDLPNELDGAEQEAELTRRLQKVALNASIGLTQMVRLPMVSGPQAVGVVYVFLAGSAYHLPQDVKMLLRSFAEQAAIAVKNARLYQEINQEKQRLDAIIEQSADGVMILDPALRITVFNQALSRMTGRPSDSVIGHQHDEIFQWRRLKTQMDLQRWTATAV